MTAREAPDRLFRHSRREAVVVLVVWALALVWSVGYCYLRGYQHDPTSWVVTSGLAQSRTPDNFRSIAGVPDWVLYGILIPWLICTAFTLLFSRFGIADDELGAEAEEGAGHGS